MASAHCLILHVDPNRRNELVSLFRAAGHHAAAAPDGSAAAAALGTPGFDVLVLDLALPELDLAALRQAMQPAEPAEPESLEAAERRHIASVLRHTGGNKRKAAHVLGISRSTLLHKVRKYGLSVIIALMAFGATDIDTGVAQVSSHDVSKNVPPAQVQSGTLSFDAHATVGDFTGTTSNVSGQITGGENLGAVRGWVEAPVKTLKTGNGKRDKDLNKSMESDKYPTMRFDVADVASLGGTSDSVGVRLRGALTLHGVRRDVDVPAIIEFTDSAIHVRSTFPVNVKDYRVTGLSKALGVLKMDEHINVHVDLVFAPR